MKFEIVRNQQRIGKFQLEKERGNIDVLRISEIK